MHEIYHEVMSLVMTNKTSRIYGWVVYCTQPMIYVQQSAPVQTVQPQRHPIPAVMFKRSSGVDVPTQT